MDKKIIALTGAKTVGKTTIAKSLNKWDAINSEIMSFASPIKDMLIAMGVPEDAIYGNKKQTTIKELGFSGRELMQSLGTEWGRDMISQDIWVLALHKKILASDSETIIIDDCRFENEAEWVRNQGGIIIKLIRDGIDFDKLHPSEIPLDSSYINCSVDISCPVRGVETLKDLCKAEQIVI